MGWYFTAWRKYADTKGRATRVEFWTFALIHIAIIFGMVGILMLQGPTLGSETSKAGLGVIEYLTTMALVVYLIASLPPALAVTVRRLHDSGRRGWWLLVALIPLLGIVILILMLSLDSQKWARNRWGPEPTGW